jgi:hypothetical protein
MKKMKGVTPYRTSLREYMDKSFTSNRVVVALVIVVALRPSMILDIFLQKNWRSAKRHSH